MLPYSTSTSSKIPNLWTIGVYASEYGKRDLMAGKNKDFFELLIPSYSTIFEL